MKNFLLLPVYFDYSSTTPVDPRLIEKILPYFYYKFGNYKSNNLFGWQTNYILENSRKKISKFLNCNSRELIFTSCVTESNNLCIKGVSYFYKNKGNHILTFKNDHKSIIESYSNLIIEGYNITFINFKKNGLINFDLLNKYINYNTIIISLSYVNSEIGTIQNIFKLSKFCKYKNLIFHLDISQGNFKIFINLKFLKLDLVSISSHKSYGPKGISLIYIRRKSNIFLKTLINGGGHENNLRSGTLPIHLISGLGEIFYILKNEYIFINLKIKNFKNILFYELLKFDNIYLNGDFKYRIPNNLNINFSFLKNDFFLISLNNFSLSISSACSLIHSSTNSLRFTFGNFNKIKNFYFFINNFIKILVKNKILNKNFLY